MIKENLVKIGRYKYNELIANKVYSIKHLKYSFNNVVNIYKTKKKIEN